MPGARSRDFRLGDTAELLAQFALSTMAFTAPVPRQEDIGYDFVCTTMHRQGALLRAGPVFSVQVKSRRAPVVFEKPHELDWIRSQENPLLIGVASRAESRADLYSTWNLLNGVLSLRCNRIVLEPGGPDARCDEPRSADDRSEQVIPLGRPIVTLTTAEALDEDVALSRAAVLRAWVELDRENIVNSATGMYWTVGPVSYETNQLPSDATEKKITFFWNAKNLSRCELNFGRTATALRLVLRRALTAEGERAPANAERIAALEQALRAFQNALEPLSVNLLRQTVGLNLHTTRSTSELGGLTTR